MVIAVSLKKFADSGLELGHHVLPEVAEPLVVALHERQVLVLVGLERLELVVLPARLVALQVLHDVVIEVSLQDVQLVIVLVVEFLALLSLKEVVCLILVAVLDCELLELLLSDRLQLEDDAVLDLELCALQGVEGRAEVLNVDIPRASIVCQVVQRLLLLLLECLTFSHFLDLCLYLIIIK